MSKKIKINVSMEVTIPQALALKSMFKYWNDLGAMGSSRKVAFYVDGDGNFQPKCNFSTNAELPELTEKMEQIVVCYEDDGNRVYDFDGIAWILEEEQEKRP